MCHPMVVGLPVELSLLYTLRSPLAISVVKFYVPKHPSRTITSCASVQFADNVNIKFQPTQKKHIHVPIFHGGKAFRMLLSPRKSAPFRTWRRKNGNAQDMRFLGVQAMFVCTAKGSFSTVCPALHHHHHLDPMCTTEWFRSIRKYHGYDVAFSKLC